MTTNLFKITPTPPTAIKVEPGQEGKLSFTVESLAAPEKVHEILLQAQLVGADGKGEEVDWLVATLQRPASMPGGKTETVISGGKTETVIITARPKSTSPRGEHKIKLVIADKERPNDVYADSPSVVCEVAGPIEAPRPAKSPRWLIPVLVGGLLVLVGGGVAIWKLVDGGGGGRAGFGEPCGEGAGACDVGLLCAAGVQQCLLAGGVDCKPARADQCASGECDRTAKVCAIPLGAACDPADKDVVPCPTNSACDPATRTCLGNVGAACKLDAECATGKCTGNLCAIQEPALKAGDPCEATCPEPLQCSAATKRCVEQLGRPCSNNNQCVTGLCEASLCAAPQLLRDCTSDGICGADQKCIDVQPGLKRCVWQPGHACTASAECSSKWCNQGICSRDDGKCDTQNDCPSPYLCITAKQRCLKPNGELCGGNVECDSAFCSNNRCAPSLCVPPCTGLFRCNNDPSNPHCVRLPIHVRPFDRFGVPWKSPISGP